MKPPQDSALPLPRTRPVRRRGRGGAFSAVEATRAPWPPRSIRAALRHTTRRRPASMLEWEAYSLVIIPLVECRNSYNKCIVRCPTRVRGNSRLYCRPVHRSVEPARLRAIPASTQPWPRPLPVGRSTEWLARRTPGSEGARRPAPFPVREVSRRSWRGPLQVLCHGI